MNLDANVLHGAHSPNGLNQLFLFQLVRRSGHDVNLYSAARRPDQPLNDDSILVALVLHKERILRGVDKLRDTFSPVAAAPDQARIIAPFEGLSVPVGFKAFNYFGNFVSMRSDD